MIKNQRELTKDEFEKISNPSYDLEKEKEDYKNNLKTAYRNIIDILKKYCDMKEEYYNIVALWIIGTYFHDKFPSYPYLYINAMKGSGKTRLLKIITHLSKEGQMLNSLTEAVLFRTEGMLGIDEFEGIVRKGNEALKELLNSAYKEGTKVKRMKKQKTLEGVEQVVEEFDVYRPISICNIYGMDEVLNDRCISIILEKSFDKKKVNLIEIFRHEKIVENTIKILKECSKCRCSSFWECIYMYELWNDFITNNYTYYTNNTTNTNYTYYIDALKTINSTDLTGRELELCFPLFLVALEIDVDLLKTTTLILKNLFSSKKEEEFVENYDISLIDFTSQEPKENAFISVNNLTKNFKEFLQINEEWINPRWMSRALKRLNLIKEKRRKSYGVEVILNIEKAKQKIKMFK